MKGSRFQSTSQKIKMTLAALATSSCFAMRTNADPVIGCPSVFKVNSNSSMDSDYQLRLNAQARQFVQLLIDSQKKDLSSSDRQKRLEVAQSILEELKTLHPEVSELIRQEWLSRLTGSESGFQMRLARLTIAIQTLERSIVALRSQSMELAEWMILKDSLVDPAARTELGGLLEAGQGPGSGGDELEIRMSRYVTLDRNGISIELDARAFGGHTRTVLGALSLPDGSVLTRSDDRTLILWKSEGDKFILSQKLGQVDNNDQDQGHTSYITGARVLLDGRILSWSNDRTLILWKQERGLFIIDKRLGDPDNNEAGNGHVSWINGADELPNGRILSWSGDHTLILWKLENERFVIEQRLGKVRNAKLQMGHVASVNGAQVLSNGKIMSWSSDQTLILWKLVNDQFTFDQRIGIANGGDIRKGHIISVQMARALPDGNVISNDFTQRLLLWALELPNPVRLKVDNLSKELDSLKAELSALRAQEAPGDASRVNSEL